MNFLKQLTKMKQLTDSQLINLLSVVLGIILGLSGLMIWYFKNEIQRLNNYGDRTFNMYFNCFNKLGIYQRHNFKYTKICRKLYNQLEAEKLENEYYKGYTNTLIEKIAKLENKKLKPKPKK